MRVPQKVRDCVVYLCDEEGRPIGTGFLVGIPTSDARAFTYVVTAAHILDGRSRVKVRFNTKLGTESYDTTPPLDWWVSDDPTSDVACAHFPGRDDLAISMIHPDHIVDDAFLISNDVGPGDEVLFTGLFTRTPGEARNLPIVRTGLLSRMNEEPISQRRRRPEDGFRELDAILVETHSRGGNSGAPAFILFPLNRYMGTINESRIGKTGPRMHWALLGLVSGHWDFLLNDGTVHDKDEINSGMALVLPGQHILDLLKREDVLMDRKSKLDTYLIEQTTYPDGLPENR